MKYFCLPSDFKFETIDSLYELNSKYEDSKVVEIYGQLAPDKEFGSCRASSQLPEIDITGLEKYITYSQDKKIDFNYTFNSTCMSDQELTGTGYKKIKDFLHLLQETGVSSITLALPSLMEITKYAAPKLKIKASTVCQVNSPLKAKFYDELGVKRIVLDEDIYRKFDILTNIRSEYTGELEIIVNSYCVNDCPYKMFHYNSLSLSHLGKETYPYYSTRCKHIHIGPENFMKLNWIRPEDIHYYSETGINYFKIQGRTTVATGNPVKAAAYYMDGFYEGDLISLFELFSTKRNLAIAETAVDNRVLDGFFDKFVNNPESCTKICEDCGYCKSYGEACIKKIDTFLMDLVKTMSNSLLENFPSSIDKV